MRKFTRAPAPDCWADNEERWNGQWVALLGQNPSGLFTWYRIGGRTAREIALPQLKAQTESHCSFCDAFPVAGVSLETVEHFRPKCLGKFPANAFTWGNLYYCCSQCQSHKRETWDEALLAFDHDEYSFDRFFEFDFTTGQVKPSSIADDAAKQRAQRTIEIYGLDSTDRRRARLLEMRKWSRFSAAERILDEFAYRSFLQPG